ncbi:PAS domain S-box-containing protein/TyrR family helix-turn-helix protein [Anoxybacillus tepidamans]|uniref:HTH-type transcriptional regulatory protein TyrR n=1 Tax=Anoxybacteroides tepidamans TaxID=265948 RepID=A0A7W8IMN0_9BACL|nr:sigma 54-interacting transcriptional regulator [Anoxybacillus tepidamans]MBB5323312.1 PAS domain S-box-containing protein/TyrR family helix-turn-helix protein [Anoxybacillus tepidamans]
MTTAFIDPEILKNIFSSISNGVVVIDRSRNILFINSSAKKLLQIEHERWEGRDIRELIPNTQLPYVLESGESSIGVKMNIGGRQCLVNRTPLYRDGELIGAIGVLQDISEMEHYHSLLKQMETIIEFSTDGIYVVDQNGITLMVNSAYEMMTGFRREELIGKHMQSLVNEGYFDQSVSLLVLKHKKRISILQKIGGKKDVIVTGNPVFNQQGDIEMVVTSVRDISHLIQMKIELEKAKSFSEMSHHRYTFSVGDSDEKIVFRSHSMKQIFDKMKQIAPYPATVLLTGPSGVGKEVIANFIHNVSPRKDHPFIKVNCGAIPEALLESELFGYEKGAFTGARQDGKIGLLELADKGTIMLDEIGEMPLSLQVKLLRVLQEKQVQRIGSHKTKKLDVRIIAATNQNLKELISQGKFREDLYYRLQVIEIYIPPLCERPEDIEPLLDHYFSFYCKLYRINKHLSPKTKEILQRYHWPGNVRELKNLMENMVVSIPSQFIEPRDLPLHIHDQVTTTYSLTLKQQIEQFEKRIIQEAIQKYSSVRKAAKQLGIDHSTLVKKLKKWKT